MRLKDFISSPEPDTQPMKIIHCSFEQHAEDILAIFNDAILNSTALFVYQPRTMAFMQEWFAGKKESGIPVLGMVDDSGTLLGFASFGPFRPQAAYKYTVEHSVYVHKDQRGRGIGEQLMRELIKIAEQQQYHVLIAAVDAANQGSVALHRKLGFSNTGNIREAAFKFGQWRDLAFFQLTLATPDNPTDG